MTTSIRRWVETDTGHRVPNHKSMCRNLHVVTKEGVSEEGMLIDFGDISKILEEHIHDVVDHAFIVFEGDTEAMQALEIMNDDHRSLVVPFIPTAENLAKWAFSQIELYVTSAYGNELRLVAFHVRETPKSWATWRP